MPPSLSDVEGDSRSQSSPCLCGSPWGGSPVQSLPAGQDQGDGTDGGFSQGPPMSARGVGVGGAQGKAGKLGWDFENHAICSRNSREEEWQRDELN